MHYNENGIHLHSLQGEVEEVEEVILRQISSVSVSFCDDDPTTTMKSETTSSETSLGTGNTAISTTTTSSSALSYGPLDDALLLELSDRIVDISNLVSMGRTAYGGHQQPRNQQYIATPIDDNDPTASSSSSLPESTPFKLVISIYPNVGGIIDESIPELDVDEFFPTTIRHATTNSNSSNNNRYPNSTSSIPEHNSLREANQSFATTNQEVAQTPSLMNRRMDGLEQLQHDRSQQLSRRDVLLLSKQQESYRLNTQSSALLLSKASLAYSMSTFNDEASVANSDTQMSNTAYSDSFTYRESPNRQRQIDMTRQQSLMAMQRAISVRHHRGDGGFTMVSLNDDEQFQRPTASTQQQQQQQRPLLRHQESYSNRNSSPRINQGDMYHLNHLQRQRPSLRSQDSFNSQSFSYHSNSVDTQQQYSALSDSNSYMNRHNTTSATATSNHHFKDANAYIMNSYNLSHDQSHSLQNSSASIDAEEYDEFANDECNKGSNNHPFMVERLHHTTSSPSPSPSTQQQQQNRFAYQNTNFQLQRGGGGYHQSERFMRATDYPRNDSSNQTQMNMIHHQNYSQRHMPNYATQQHQGRLSQSYHHQDDYPNHTSHRLELRPSIVEPSVPIQSSSSKGTSQSLASSQQPFTIEISPGLFATIRGAEETRSAIDTNFLIHLRCIACTIHVSCIADAAYVLCPICKVISPTGTVNPTGTMAEKGIGGVGLGFCSESLVTTG